MGSRNTGQHIFFSGNTTHRIINALVGAGGGRLVGCVGTCDGGCAGDAVGGAALMKSNSKLHIQ